MKKNIYGNDKLEFRQVVLAHLKNITDLSLRSNADGQSPFLYFNSVEALSDLLVSFFDKKMNDEIEEFEKSLVEISKENAEKLKSLSPADYSKKYSAAHFAKKRTVYRIIFRKLNQLLERNDYLKTSVFGEDKDEVATEEDDEND